MKEIRRYQVRGIPGAVTRADFAGRIVDFWAPEGGSEHLLVAHDGQNIFDPRTATHLRQTWKLTQSAIRVAKENNQKPPLVIGVFHSSNKTNPHGRIKDLTPEDIFRTGVQPSKPISDLSIDDLNGNQYLESIWNTILPAIAQDTNSKISPEKTAMLGSSMGGLATLYSFANHSAKFHTALAFSPHWVLAGNELVDQLIEKLPSHHGRKLWMSRGTKGLDASYEPFQLRADDLVRRKGWSSNFVSKVFHRTGHNERSWSSYVDEALRFWLSKSVDTNSST
jgi:predicted alpha/beta superfamily hydrolase